MQAWQAQGVFWLPEAPGRKLYGTLSCNDEGELNLALLGAFGRSHERILGSILRGDGLQRANEAVTLQGCIVTKESVSSGDLGTRQEFLAHRAFIGAHLESESQFKSASVTFSGLSAWADNFTGLSTDQNYSGVSWNTPPVLPSGKISGALFLLGVGTSFSGTKRKKIIEEEIGISFTFDQPIDESSLSSQIIYPFQNFFTFATDAPNALTNLVVTRDQLSPERIGVHGPTTFSDLSPTADLHAYKLLFALADIQDRLEDVFARWLRLSKRFEKAMVIYFGNLYRPAGYTDMRVQQAINAACLYYSSQGDDDGFQSSVERELQKIAQSTAIPADLRSTLRSHPVIWAERALAGLLRQHKELAPLVTDKDGRGSEKFIEYATNTLRYVNTRETPRGPFAQGGADYYWLSERVSFIIKVSLLKELGFTDEQRAAILGRNAKFDHIVRNINPLASWT